MFSSGLSCDLFSRPPHDQFQIEQARFPSLSLELVEAEAIQAPAGSEAFSLVFRGPPYPFLPQANYRFQHRVLDVLDMFIVAVNQDQHGFYYEAIFSRPRAGEPS
jgi:hypothetical protein